MKVSEKREEGIVGITAELSTFERIVLGLDMAELKLLVKECDETNKKDSRSVFIPVGLLRKVDGFISQFLLDIDVEATGKGLYSKSEPEVKVKVKVKDEAIAEDVSSAKETEVEDEGEVRSDVPKMIRVNVDNMPKIGK